MLSKAGPARRAAESALPGLEAAGGAQLENGRRNRGEQCDDEKHAPAPVRETVIRSGKTVYVGVAGIAMLVVS
jgi:hypothetical protein